VSEAQAELAYLVRWTQLHQTSEPGNAWHSLLLTVQGQDADSESNPRALLCLQACDSGPVQQLELDLLVGCGRRGPSAAVARCLGGAGLVWDGRLVVDASYNSSDAAVMGAGPASKFSR
jgi:hypothetical protein